MTLGRGVLGRIGGVMFDVEKACEKFQASLPKEAMEHLAGPPDLRCDARQRLVDIAAQTVMLVVQMDTESRIKCENPDHDRFGQRRMDCTECFADEQASLSTSLAVLVNPSKPPPKTPIDQSTDWKVASPYEPRCMVTKVGGANEESRCVLVPHDDQNHRWGPLQARKLTRAKSFREFTDPFDAAAEARYAEDVKPHHPPQSPLRTFHDIKLKGWNCPACKVFNGEEKEVMHVCRSCGGDRPV